MSLNASSDLTLKQVYAIFCKYWNEENRIWVYTTDNCNYNIKLSLNDFLHFSQIDKILKLEKVNAKQKKNYINNKIMSDELNFQTLEQSLNNSKQNRYFPLKKKAIIALALSIQNQKKLFNKVCHEAGGLYPNVKPDFILINELKDGRYLLHCNYISIINNFAHPKSLMYCKQKHQRYNDLLKFSCVNIKGTKFIKNKGNGY